MRLRKVKNADKIISTSKYIISNPSEYKDNWTKLFGNDNPIYIEIGMGKGNFIKDNAIKYPNINFIGIEKYDSVLARAVQKFEDLDIANLKLICIDALDLTSCFGKEISLIYLNFSDPWPKERHYKRRLTSDIFLSIYEQIFINDYQITQKTDNYNLFEYSKQQFINHNYNIEINDFNILNMPEDNIMTEYESKFLKENKTIYKIKASKKKEENK